MPATRESHLLLCPLCQGPLRPPEGQGQTFTCPQHHSFDLARQGYLHLLPVQQKRSRAPGDDKAMVQSRKAFLSAGYYEPLAQRILALLGEHLDAAPSKRLLDAGCGEGYYAEYMQQHWPGEPPEIYGIDISKPAVLGACQRSKQIAWLVASLRQIPLATASLDAIISVFSPIQDQAFQRCLKPNGLLLQVSPGDTHLQSLKSLLYDEVQPFDEYKALTQRQPQWQLISREKLSYRFHLDHSDMIGHLLAMTPHTWRISPEKRSRLSERSDLECEADFLITCWHPLTTSSNPQQDKQEASDRP